VSSAPLAARVTVAVLPLASRRVCSACGREKNAVEFYRHRFSPLGGRPMLFSTCKPCFVVAVIERRARARVRFDAAHPHVVFLRSEGISVKVHVAPAFVAPPIVEPAFPAWGTTPLCSRGNHEWPIETTCRGYEALGCGGAGAHVHLSCLAHACEVIEAAPAMLRRRT
jgi:hypothetical protein